MTVRNQLDRLLEVEDPREIAEILNDLADDALIRGGRTRMIGKDKMRFTFPSEDMGEFIHKSAEKIEGLRVSRFKQKELEWEFTVKIK